MNINNKTNILDNYLFHQNIYLQQQHLTYTLNICIITIKHNQY